MEHPTPALPHSETTMLIHGLKQLDRLEWLLEHPRAMNPDCPPQTLHYPRRKKPMRKPCGNISRMSLQDMKGRAGVSFIPIARPSNIPWWDQTFA